MILRQDLTGGSQVWGRRWSACWGLPKDRAAPPTHARLGQALSPCTDGSLLCMLGRMGSPWRQRTVTPARYPPSPFSPACLVCEDLKSGRSQRKLSSTRRSPLTQGQALKTSPAVQLEDPLHLWRKFSLPRGRGLCLHNE